MASTECDAAVDGVRVQLLPDTTGAPPEPLQQLVVDSRWNQTIEDWALFLHAGSVYVASDADAGIVASGAVLPMDALSASAMPSGEAASVAWISMILVKPSWRGRGLGRTVFERCLRHVQAEGRVAMLDATPAGEALYRSFGFQVLWRLTRWRREARVADSTVAEPARGTLDRLLALDAEALGFDRARVLRGLAERPGSRLVSADHAGALVRAGRSARHLGPMLACSDTVAAQLLASVAESDASALLIDVPDDRPSMQRTLEACGFRPERPFARMALATPGRDLPGGNTQLIHAIAGPEYA